MKCARKRVDVAARFLNETDDATETCEAVEGKGVRCQSITGDADSFEFCQRLVAEHLRPLDASKSNQLSSLTKHCVPTSTSFLTKAGAPHLKNGPSAIMR
ncbi:MAG: hypothetical protein RL693_140, partial [Verrucomicrobiota bacterium]